MARRRAAATHWVLECGRVDKERFLPVGSDGLEPSPTRVRTERAAANTLIPCSDNSPNTSRDGRTRTDGPVVPGHVGCRSPTSRFTSQNGRIRTGGLLAPDQARYQVSPRSDCAPRSSPGSPVTFGSGLEGARILLSWFSARRYTISATSPSTRLSA